MAAKLQRHTSNADVIAWWDINPRDWISESAQIRETVYPKPPEATRKDSRCPSCPIPTSIKFTPVMERRLSQAGVRLAAYLNAIYAEPQPLPAEPAR